MRDKAWGLEVNKKSWRSGEDGSREELNVQKS